MKTILICGDSYSDANNISCDFASIGHWSWVDRLKSHYTVKCIAKVAASNLDIWRQIQTANDDWDHIIVNLSDLRRRNSYHWKSGTVKLSKEDEQRANLRVAREIAQRQNTLCWTPFPGYSGIAGIHYIPLEEHNEMYTKSVRFECTSHHLTREGNDQLYKWMLKQL